MSCARNSARGCHIGISNTTSGFTSLHLLAAVLLALGAGVLLAGSQVHGDAGQTKPGGDRIYFPERFDWQHRAPGEVGIDAAKLDEVVKFAVANESPSTKDLAMDLALTFGREPFGNLIGPTKERGAANGLVIRHGYIVAEWGDVRRVDMTFSVTKSFLSTVVGLAWQKGLIRDVNDRVRDYMPTPEL